jgi:alpha-2-macroglobulin
MQEQLPMPHVVKGTGKSLLTTPGKCGKRRKQAASGSPFLWILSFGEAKESISPVGARTHIQTTVALATPFYLYPLP